MLLLLCPLLSMAQQPTMKGYITTTAGTGIANATVISMRGNGNTMTAHTGAFSLPITTLPDTILVTHINYKTKQYVLNSLSGNNIVIVMDEAVNELDETVVIGYGVTSKRYNTGSVARVQAKEIAKQPVGDVLTTLIGRMAGVSVTQTSGVPGSTVKLQVRGRNSITQGSEPLYIIDGVPMAAQNQPVNKMNSVLVGGAGTGLSGLGTIVPGDIESIEVLKDADATAIYGSRGANGVVLITTKKGSAGATKVNVDVYRSTSALTRTVEMMQTPEYLEMRKEAFANDGVIANATNAPDIMVWDTNRYTNMQELVYSGYAPTVNVNASVTGGDIQTQFLLGGSYRKEQTMFEKSMGLQRASAVMNLHHRSRDRRMEMGASVNFGHTKNELTANEPGYVINLVPNLPELYDNAGKLNWQSGGVAFENPLAYTLNKYDATTESINGRLTAGYTVVRGVKLSTAIGYNTLRTDEVSKRPLAAQSPANNPLAALELGNNFSRAWIVEPQVEYEVRVGDGQLKLLTGATLQDNVSSGSYIRATGYSSDNLISSVAAAPTIASRRNNYVQYKYQALFARVHYILQDKYILNVSGRRDGSSRFGPGKQYSLFGAAGAAWLFGNEVFIKRTIPALSYGKLRMSYGSSGNDQIGDYSYLDAWGSGNAYQGTSTLYPLNLYNPDYRWEVNKKAEAAIALGFFKDRLLMNVAWYRNRSSNQLVSYRLPSQTGFNGVTQNLDALIENTGVEIELNTKNVQTKHFEWSTSFNISLPKNSLVDFPDLENSSYANFYVKGESLNVIYRYDYKRVNPATGVFEFEDMNKDGAISIADLVVRGDTDPVYFGGLQNSFRYKGFELDVFATFRKQTGLNFLYSMYSANNIPGMMYNLPVLARDRWRQPGDVAMMQRMTAVTTSDAYKANSNFLLSDGVYGDASFIRIQNVSLRYHLPEMLLKKAGLRSVVLYVQGNNVATITKYKGADPEVQNLWMQSPLRTWAVGVRVSL